MFAWLARFHVAPRASLHGVAVGGRLAVGRDVRLSTLYGGYAWYAVLGRKACAIAE